MIFFTFHRLVSSAICMSSSALWQLSSITSFQTVGLHTCAHAYVNLLLTPNRYCNSNINPATQWTCQMLEKQTVSYRTTYDHSPHIYITLDLHDFGRVMALNEDGLMLFYRDHSLLRRHLHCSTRNRKYSMIKWKKATVG